ncbi:hypothetical protein R1flu_008086 [Riccia fluitans]|uniref:Uncharacterized protein n=1 Tax=Riccia fluitans TaxID=41844 RepID=A0ABD1YAP4_9MARC
MKHNPGAVSVECSVDGSSSGMSSIGLSSSFRRWPNFLCQSQVRVIECLRPAAGGVLTLVMNHSLPSTKASCFC